MTDLTPLVELAAALREEGGLLGDALRERPVGDALPEGPRAEVRVLLEAVREGYELHYGAAGGRVVATEDADLALLGGDRLYALGLERLAALGDLDAVRALADLISEVARAHAEDRPEGASAAWSAALTIVHRARTREPGAMAGADGARRA